MTKFIKVENENISSLAILAKEIWFDYWEIIISYEQITYMVEKFQSEKAIKGQIREENYIYYFISYNNKNVGYFGLSNKKEYLFLSKLYIKSVFRGKGLGKEAFKKIKEIAYENNLKSIRLTVNKYNKNTINTYEKWGFKTIDSVVADIGGGFVMDDYIMERDL